jgi:hypothetical protein
MILGNLSVNETIANHVGQPERVVEFTISCPPAR